MARYFNIPFYTFGGINLWQDVAVSSGWRVQKSLLSNSYRLIDDRNIRRYRGDKKSCIAVMQKYISDWEIPEDAEEVTLILGGLLRTRLCFSSLAKDISCKGFPCFYINSSPTFTGIRESSLSLMSILSNFSPSVKRVNFITFGIGGLILRQTLAFPSNWQEKIKVGKVLMIAVPNKGSLKAEKLSKNVLFRFAMGKALRPLQPKEAGRIPPLPKDTTIALLAGNRFHKNTADASDGFVFVREIDTEGTKEKILLNYTHIGIMSAKKITSYAVNYLRHGTLSYIRSNQAFFASSAVKPADSNIAKVQENIAQAAVRPAISRISPAVKRQIPKKSLTENKTFAKVCNITNKTADKSLEFLKTAAVFSFEKLTEASKVCYSFSKSCAKKAYTAYCQNREEAKKKKAELKAQAELAAKVKAETEAELAKKLQIEAEITAKAQAEAEKTQLKATKKADISGNDSQKAVESSDTKDSNKLKAIFADNMPYSTPHQIKPVQEKAWREEQIHVVTSSNGVSSYFTPFTGFLNN